MGWASPIRTRVKGPMGRWAHWWRDQSNNCHFQLSLRSLPKSTGTWLDGKPYYSTPLAGWSLSILCSTGSLPHFSPSAPAWCAGSAGCSASGLFVVRLLAKEDRGLRIRRLDCQNSCMLLKLLHCLHHPEGSTWAAWVGDQVNLASLAETQRDANGRLCAPFYRLTEGSPMFVLGMGERVHSGMTSGRR
jgi:hypothetical protein